MFNAYRKIKDRVITLLQRIRYAGILEVHGKVKIDKRVSLSPFRGKKRTLKVVLHQNTHLKHDCIIQGTGTFSLGENSYISSYCVIGVNESIQIGKNVMIANAVSIRDTDHLFDDISLPMNQQGYRTRPVVIKDNVWIGHGVVITKGVTIEEGAIIAANAVVTKDVPKNTIVGGVPAKIIRER